QLAGCDIVQFVAVREIGAVCRAVGKADAFSLVVEAPAPNHRISIDPSDDTARSPDHQLARNRVGSTAAIVIGQPAYRLPVVGECGEANGLLVSALRRGDCRPVTVADVQASR